MPTKKKSKAAPRSAAKTKQVKPKATKKAKFAPAASIDWSQAIRKAAAQKRAQATWPGTGQSWKKKART
ncbi:MAG: hypothetical protein GX535_05820 [Xanthomonadaceae bacterium]|nr:hypothetical protein [Xanthomonadaceae bacterium]